MRGPLGQTLAVTGFFAVLTVALTWPQVALLGTHVPSFDDSLLSVWRIAWIAHALGSPATLADANIFHPEARTLAYTDAVLLQGLVATPFIRAGVPAVAVYNLLILGSMALSGVVACLLARQLTGQLAAGLIAGVVFAFVTYRFDHYMHLELQATIFLVLALWFLDRVFERGRWRDVASFAGCLLLQLFSGIYYTVFLVTALAAAMPFRWLGLPPTRRRQVAGRLAVTGAAAALCAVPYLTMYLQNRASVGERGDADVARYSATPVNYLASDPYNIAHGGWGGDLGRPERRLFPGIAAVGLALLGLREWSPRKTTVAIVGVVGFLLSLGVNTPVFEWLRELVVPYRGLRAPARAGILVMLAVAVFAACGWARVLQRFPRWRVIGTGVVLAVMAVEYARIPGEWLAVSSTPSALARWLALQPRSVIVELPLPRADALHEIQDGLYMYASIFHWQPMLNGYSGFYPRSYLELLERTRDFPSDAALAYLRQRRVDFIVLHGRFLPADRFGAWAATLAARPDLEQVAKLPEPGGDDLVFKLRR